MGRPLRLVLQITGVSDRSLRLVLQITGVSDRSGGWGGTGEVRWVDHSDGYYK